MQNFEICLYAEANNSIFDLFVKEIQNNFRGNLIEKIDDGWGTKYYDFVIGKHLITLHQISILGISIFPTNNEHLDDRDIDFYKELLLFLKNKINDKI